MRRRQYLSGAVGLTATSIGVSGARQNETETNEDDSNEVNCPPEAVAEATVEDGEAEIAVHEDELIVDDSGFTTDVYVAATVENVGDAPSGEIELAADWYNEDGDYLDNDRAWLQTLRPGETWLARVRYLGGDGETVADYDLSGEVGDDPPTAADGLVLEDDHEMRVGEDEAVVEGRITNDTGTDQSYLEVIALFYDEECRVLADEWTNVTDVADGDTWAFDVTWFDLARIDDVAAYDLVVSNSSW